jgi:drug/metabolite transporter (DMT)-like permease
MTFVLIGLVMMWFGGTKTPSVEASGYLLGMIIFASSGSYYATKAMRSGEISVISPLRYTRLLFAMLVGVFILDETIDNYMLLGSAIVVGAGLYVLFREQRQKIAA